MHGKPAASAVDWRGAGGQRGELPLFRVVANRDEQRSRPGALPPRLTRHEGSTCSRRSIPWVGARGLPPPRPASSSCCSTSTVLSRPTDRGLRSRGLVIPALVGSESLGAVRERASSLDPESFLPFRLLVVDRHHLVEVITDGRTLTFGSRDTGSRRVLRCSSLVDQQRARACRTALFGHLVTGPSRWAQDAFHRATWPGDEALGVRMSREDACTVSVTTVEVFENRISMTYCASLPDQAGVGHRTPPGFVAPGARPLPARTLHSPLCCSSLATRPVHPV